MAPRSYLSLTKDELAHADALHRESIVIDASIVAFIDNVGEDLMLEDMARGASPRGTLRLHAENRARGRSPMSTRGRRGRRRRHS